MLWPYFISPESWLPLGPVPAGSPSAAAPAADGPKNKTPAFPVTVGAAAGSVPLRLETPPAGFAAG